MNTEAGGMTIRSSGDYGARSHWALLEGSSLLTSGSGNTGLADLTDSQDNRNLELHKQSVEDRDGRTKLTGGWTQHRAHGFQFTSSALPGRNTQELRKLRYPYEARQRLHQGS